MKLAIYPNFVQDEQVLSTLGNNKLIANERWDKVCSVAKIFNPMAEIMKARKLIFRIQLLLLTQLMCSFYDG